MCENKSDCFLLLSFLICYRATNDRNTCTLRCKHLQGEYLALIGLHLLIPVMLLFSWLQCVPFFIDQLVSTLSTLANLPKQGSLKWAIRLPGRPQEPLMCAKTCFPENALHIALTALWIPGQVQQAKPRMGLNQLGLLCAQVWGDALVDQGLEYCEKASPSAITCSPYLKSKDLPVTWRETRSLTSKYTGVSEGANNNGIPQIFTE